MAELDSKKLESHINVDSKHKTQNTKQQAKQEEKRMTTETETAEKALWMLEGSHGMTRDADGAVVLLEDLVNKHRNNNNTDAMWMLGVCCEFGIGTEQDVHRAEQLFESAAQQGNTTAMLLTDKLKNKNGRGCMEMDLGSEQTTNTKTKQNAKHEHTNNKQ